jgi:putative ABC transport system permease protein
MGMRYLLARSSWRFFTRHPWQLWLTLLSIALGTAVMIAVDLANHSAAQSFQRSVNALSSPMTHEITAMRGRIPDGFYQKLRIQWGYRFSQPQVEVAVTANGLHYTVLGIDPLAVSLPENGMASLDSAQVTQLLTDEHAVIAAQQSGLKMGQDLISGEQHFKVVALVDLPRNDLVLTDIATAQGKSTGLSQIQLKLSETEAAQLQTLLTPDLKLESFAQQQNVFGQMTQAFSTNLLAMSLLAMLVGAFLVYNTMTFSVLQRRSSFAIARMVGVTAGQLFRHLLLEAFILGSIGSLFGVLLGVLLGQGLLVLVTQTISDLYVTVQPTDLLITPSLALKGVSITLLAVLLATLAPAFEAARVSPVQVQRQSSLERSNQSLSGKLALAGVVLVLTSWLVIKVSGQQLVLGFVGLFLLILGYSLVVPWVLRKVLAYLQRGLQFIAKPSVLLPIALRGVEASLSRTSLAIIALTVAVSATVGVSMMIGSFRASVSDWLELTLPSDLYISAISEDGSRVEGNLNPQWLARVQQLPQLSNVSLGRSVRLTVEGMPLPTLVLQPGQQSQRGFEFLQATEQTWAQFLKGEGVLVSEPFAYHHQHKLGDRIQFNTETVGTVALPILGVFRDYSATQGMLVLPRSLYEHYWLDHGISSIGLSFAKGVDSTAIKQQLKTWATELNPEQQALVIRSNVEIRQNSLKVFDRTFAITQVLRVLVLIVAFVGVFSALMALFLEKGREFAILRATGFTPKQLQGLVLGQAALLGLLAGILALPLGWLMSLVLIDIINQRSFGWTMHSYFFASIPLQALLLAIFAALLASLYPIKRLGQLSIREGLYGR